MYIRGVELNVEITGGGTPFIWAHGLTSSIEGENASGFDWDWRPEYIQLVRYDARGHGKSQASYKPQDYYWSNISQDMLAIADAIGANIFEFHQGPFDTLLMMMHGIGLVEDVAGLDRFLHHAHKLLKPGSRIVLDSLDARNATGPDHLAYMDSNRRAGRYFGEIRMCFEYKGQRGRFLVGYTWTPKHSHITLRVWGGLAR